MSIKDWTKGQDVASRAVGRALEQSFMANTLEHYCHSVKVQDPDSKAKCLECWWYGRHDELNGYKESK